MDEERKNCKGPAWKKYTQVHARSGKPQKRKECDRILMEMEMVEEKV